MHGNVCLHKIANYVETGKALSLHLNILNLNVFLNKPQKKLLLWIHYRRDEPIERSEEAVKCKNFFCLIQEQNDEKLCCAFGAAEEFQTGLQFFFALTITFFFVFR